MYGTQISSLSSSIVAEKSFRDLRQLAQIYKDVDFVAISHSDTESTDKWVRSLGGAQGVQVIIDADRKIYGQWGLGVSSTWHVLNPFSLWKVYQLGKKENIWNRPTESGTRWQMSGAFAVDKQAVVKWSRPAPAADDIPDYREALQALGVDL